MPINVPKKVGRKEPFFNWKEPLISNWLRCFRIKFNNNIPDPVRGLSASESAMTLLKYKDRLTKEEIDFLKSLAGLR